MLANLLLPAIPGIQLGEVLSDESSITLVMTTTHPSARCPLCQRGSARIHSRYVRKIADVPWGGVPVKIRLRVRRFFCDNPDCPRRIFVERLSPAVAPYARRTRRLEALLQAFGLTLGGEAGAPLARRSGLPVSPNTLLRLVRRISDQSVPTARVLGVDDWAKRKGTAYGTILVDLEQHRPIDLLPDREPASLATWLRRHPGVEIIARDRSKDYAHGAAQGAPHACQVADRFHLLSNWREALQRLLQRHPADLRAAGRREDELRATELACAPESVAATPQDLSTPALPRPAVTPTALSERERRYQKIRQLAHEGLSERAIARCLPVNRATVRKYLRSPETPVDHRGPSSRLAAPPYRDYLQRRWAEGARNIRALWRELQDQGYPGSYSSVWEALTRFPRAPGPGDSPLRTAARRPLSARQASWLLVQTADALTPEQLLQQTALRETCTVAATAYPLAQSFVQMVRERQADHLDAWLEQAEASALPDLRHFAKGLRQDYAAVQAGLSLPWSNGQTEGQVNRLKAIRRQMYGRGNFDLVRQRVLYRRN